jgi:hypothetical protein
VIEACAVKWRTGSEARISTLKRQYGWVEVAKAWVRTEQLDE